MAAFLESVVSSDVDSTPAGDNPCSALSWSLTKQETAQKTRISTTRDSRVLTLVGERHKGVL